MSKVMTTAHLAFILNTMALFIAAFVAFTTSDARLIVTSIGLLGGLVLQMPVWKTKPSHPIDERHRRSEMQECQFRIDPDWESASGWSENGKGDVLVDLLTSIANERNIYLIPSGNAPKELEDVNQLKNKRNMDIKREATLDFIRRKVDKTLKGYYFTMQPSGTLKVKVYSNDYDRILKKYAKKKLRG